MILVVIAGWYVRKVCHAYFDMLLREAVKPNTAKCWVCKSL